MKICALISSHSSAVYTKLTIASLLRHLGKNHQIQIHVGIHSNLDDYTNDLSLLREFEDICQFHTVDEIDWYAHNTDIYRYSKMHSKNLINLLKNVKFYDFDLLLVLDNDLHIKEDFISKLWSGEDIISSLFNDNDSVKRVTDAYGNLIDFAPKLTVWNTILSRKTYDLIIKQPDIIAARTENSDGSVPLFYDTFAGLYPKIKEWNLTSKIIKTSEMAESIHHFFGSSFNYGYYYRVHQNPDEILDKVNEIYIKDYEPFIQKLKEMKAEIVSKALTFF